MVNDRNVSLGCIVSYMLWAATLTLLVWSFLDSGMEPRTFLTMQAAAIVCAAAGGVATVRQYHVHTNRLLRLLRFNPEALEESDAAAAPPTPLRR